MSEINKDETSCAARRPRVYFLGSGSLAVPVLEKLAASSMIDFAGFATQPDRPAGRKQQLRPTPVGVWAAEHSLNPDKPASVNSPEFTEKIASLRPDIIFVASFGQILRKAILDIPGTACVNLHASLLPAYRGASPVAAAILAGDENTGISFMKMDAGLDTGPVYRLFKCPVGRLNAMELEHELGRLGADNVEELVLDVFSGRALPSAQDNSKASYAPKISKEHGAVDWQESAQAIDRKIRAYQPWPGMAFHLEGASGKSVRIAIVEAVPVDNQGMPPGSNVRADKEKWIVACSEGALDLLRVKPEGRNVMTGAEFLRGRPDIIPHVFGITG